uniref:Uncharacterized protein n=1 Tax=Meloidogyne enterolobii TaxID=390850 RepID=A0A6V7W261_MELEN|nr:unnamed protein product [Meloidogyne enterolobii]
MAWTEPEKINRLKLYLGTQARSIFESLTVTERQTLATTLKNIRKKLDSPHFRELAYKRLAACYQRESESVNDFIKRLVPLVNSTSCQVPPEVKEETLCRCFMEKVRPEYQRSLQLVGPLIGRKDFDKLTAYVQELEVASEKEGRTFNDGIHAITEQPNQMPRGRFDTWKPRRPYHLQTFRGPSTNRPLTSSNAQELGERGNKYRGQQRPQYDRRWNSRPYCHYCNRTGHEQYQCRVRKTNETKNESYKYRNNRGTNNRNDQDLREIVENLAVKVHEMKMKTNYALANQGNMKSLQPVSPPTISENVLPKVEAKEKVEPKKISSWESSFRVRVPSIASTSLMFMIMCCSALAINPVLIPKGPMICQTHRQAMLWQVPEIPSCPSINLTARHTPTLEKRRIFLPNIIEFSTKAWACRKIKKNAKKYTITGVPMEEKLIPEAMDVTLEECNQMIKHHSCSLGILKENSKFWQTENKIDLTPRSWILGSFSWENISSQNCFLFESIIDSHFGASEIVTPLGLAHECPYRKGNCILDDKTVLVWEVNSVRKCNFIPVGDKNGRCMGSVWLSDDARLGLTFENETRVTDCGVNITVSDQGLGSIILSETEIVRKKRSSRIYRKYFSDGIPTSSQIASQLTYLDQSLTKAINFAFVQSLSSFCEYTELVKHWTESSYMTNPTELARSIFSNPYLVAKRSARSLMKVWPCVPLERRDYEFRPTKLERCFEFLPIMLKTESKDHLAFLDPSTMIVSTSAKIGPCEEFRRLVIQVNDQILEVDQIEGKITSVKPNEINVEKLKLNWTGLIPKIESHAFHQLVLLNMTDVKEHSFVANMVRISQMTYEINEKDSVVLTSVSNEWKEVENQIVKGAIGDYKSIWSTIFNVIIGILAIDFAIRLGLILLEMYAGNGRLGKLIFGSKVKEVPKRVLDIRDIRRVPEQRLEIDETYEQPVNRPRPLSISWPPTVRRIGGLPLAESGTLPRSHNRINRNFIGALGSNSNNVIVGVTLEGVPLKCLVDTGAITSVANIALAEWLGTKIFKTETYLQSASEHSMCARQATSVNLKIANVYAEITIHLFNDKFHWDNHDYHFILGCDAMVLLPPILIDFKNKNLRIEGSLLEIDNRLDRPLRNFKVYALETSEIGPNQQSVMKARADFSELLRHDVYVHAIENRLADQGLSLVPLVTNPKESIRIILSNPTGIVKRIYKDTCVAIASEVLKTDSENILSEIKLNENSEEMNSLGKAGIIVDPTYKIGFEKTSVVGEDLRKLKDLCNEFEDIFSKSQYDIGSCTAGEHDIITTSEDPVASRPHRVPFKYRDELQKHIDQLLASGVMIESDTPWVSNIVLVQKKDGGLRPCIDFRKLNEVTVPDHFPLPRLETILEKSMKL